VRQPSDVGRNRLQRVVLQRQDSHGRAAAEQLDGDAGTDLMSQCRAVIYENKLKYK
jgi:hypothetical protein